MLVNEWVASNSKISIVKMQWKNREKIVLHKWNVSWTKIVTKISEKIEKCVLHRWIVSWTKIKNKNINENKSNDRNNCRVKKLSWYAGGEGREASVVEGIVL